MEASMTTIELEQRDLDGVACSCRSGSDIVVQCRKQPNEDMSVGSGRSTKTATTVATSTTSSVAPTSTQMLTLLQEDDEQVVFRRAREDRDFTPPPLPPKRLPLATAAALPLPPYASLSAAAADIDDATIDDALAVVNVGSNYDDDAVSMLAVTDDPEDERRRQSQRRRRRRRQQHDEYDVLTIFQAAPLVYTNKSTGELQSLDVLNYDGERDELENAIKETTAALPCEDDESSMMTRASSSSATRRKILDVDFQIATVDRLGLFLAEEKGEMMHFSCHGDPSYLALEDGQGGMKALHREKLKDWIAAGGRNLHFVFVSACHSSFIGQAFVDAGVPHVVCCRHDSTIRESVAVEFAKSFYRNLACGKFLQQAFDVAREEILRAEEAAKFCLLPENANHDVPIFFRKKRWPSKKRYVPPVVFPQPPQIHIGRQKELYQLIQSLQSCRLVRVSGPDGVGKNDLVKTCCQYLKDRLHQNDLHEILWVTYSLRCPTTTEVVDVPDRFANIFSLVRDDSICEDAFIDEIRNEVMHLVETFIARKMLLIFDVKDISNELSADKFSCFITLLLQKSSHHVRVWVIHRDSISIKTDRVSCLEKHLPVQRLSVDDAVDLFEILLRPKTVIDPKRHGVNSVDELCDLLLTTSTDLSSQRMQEIDKMLGNGIPLELHRFVRKITAEDIDKLVALGRRCMPKDYLGLDSRAALTQAQYQVEQRIVRAESSRDFVLCQQLKSELTELECLKARLPDLASLERDFEERSFDLDLAICSKNYEDAQKLQNELNRLEQCIMKEKRANVRLLDGEELFDEGIKTTRAALEQQICILEFEFDNAWDDSDFDTADQIEHKLNRLREMRSSKPTIDQLESEIKRLEEEQLKAKKSRSTNAARIRDKRIKKLKEQLGMEEEALQKFRMKDGDVQTQMDREAEAVPPPGGYVENVDKKSNGPISETETFSQSVPGAFQVSEKINSESMYSDIVRVPLRSQDVDEEVGGGVAYSRSVEKPEREEDPPPTPPGPKVTEQYDPMKPSQDNMALMHDGKPPPPPVDNPYALEKYTPDGGIVEMADGEWKYDASGGWTTVDEDDSHEEKLSARPRQKHEPEPIVIDARQDRHLDELSTGAVCDLLDEDDEASDSLGLPPDSSFPPSPSENDESSDLGRSPPAPSSSSCDEYGNTRGTNFPESGSRRDTNLPGSVRGDDTTLQQIDASERRRPWQRQESSTACSDDGTSTSTPQADKEGQAVSRPASRTNAPVLSRPGAERICGIESTTTEEAEIGYIQDDALDSLIEATVVSEEQQAIIDQLPLENLIDQAAIEQIVMETIRKNAPTAEVVVAHLVNEDDDVADEKRASKKKKKKKKGFGFGKIFKKWKK